MRLNADAEDPWAKTEACPFCGEADAWSVANAECTHGCQDKYLCHCGAFFPLIQARFKPLPESVATFDPGYADSMAGPGEPPQVYCPLCMSEEDGLFHVCSVDGCPTEPVDVGVLLERAYVHEREQVRTVWHAWVTGKMADQEFRATWFRLVHVNPTMFLNKDGIVVYDVRERVRENDRKFREEFEQSRRVRVPDFDEPDWNALVQTVNSLGPAEEFASPEERTRFLRGVEVLNKARVVAGDAVLAEEVKRA